MPLLEHQDDEPASDLVSLVPVFPTPARLSTKHLLEFSSDLVTLFSKNLDGS